MTILASDSGAGSDANPIGGNWTTVSGYNGLRRVSNSIRGTTAGGANVARNTAATWPADHYSKVAIGTLQAGEDGGAAARISSSAQTLYFFDRNGANVELYKDVSDVYTQLGSSVADTHSAGDVHECRAVGTTISGWKNGVQKISVTDSSISSGNAGIFWWGNTVPLTNWEGGDFASSATSLPPNRAFPRSVLGL